MKIRFEIVVDSGTQKRMLHFATPGAPAASAAPAQPQLASRFRCVAGWGCKVGRGGRGGPERELGVTTRKMKAGYLRKNGVPYSEYATPQEYLR